jgi:hypothetical protein
MVTHEYEEPVTWIRARNFVLSPGAPVPVITHPGNDWIIPTLTKHGPSYKIVFNTPDSHARYAAVKAGIGLTARPRVCKGILSATTFTGPDAAMRAVGSGTAAYFRADQAPVCPVLQGFDHACRQRGSNQAFKSQRLIN